MQAIAPILQPVLEQPINIQGVEAALDYNESVRKRRKVERASVPTAVYVQVAVDEKRV